MDKKNGFWDRWDFEEKTAVGWGTGAWERNKYVDEIDRAGNVLETFLSK